VSSELKIVAAQQEEKSGKHSKAPTQENTEADDGKALTLKGNRAAFKGKKKGRRTGEG
jgi:hypothetical protein